jgi:hypothetical protein
MQRFFFFLVLQCTIGLMAVAQKAVIDTSVFDKWPRLSEAKISNNGKYCMFTLYNVPLYSSSCIIQQISGEWKKEFPGVTEATFSEDGRKAIFNRGNDTVVLLALGDGHEQYIYPSNAFQLFMQGKEQWIACQLNNPAKELLIKSLKTGKESKIKGVESYLLSKTGNTIVYVTADTNAATHVIHWANLGNGKIEEEAIVWKGSGESNLTLDDAATQLAFKVTGNTPFSSSIWHYRITDTKAKKIADSTLASIPSDTYIESISNFSLDGRRLFFSIKEKPYPKPNADAVMVDLWSYHDAKIQSHQFKQDVDPTAGYYHIGPRRFLAVQDINSLEIKRLQFTNEEITLLPNEVSDEWARILYRRGDEIEQNWNSLARPEYYLVSTITGERKKIPFNFNHLSSTAKYLLANAGDSAMYTYEITSGKIKNITEKLPVEQSNSSEYTFGQRLGRQIEYAASWFNNDDRVVVNDGYDLWALDPRAELAAINLTNGYGVRNNVRFSLIGNNEMLQKGSKILLNAFDDNNQNDGFFSMTVGLAKDPVKLTSGPYIYAAGAYGMHLDARWPIKARNADVYLVGRQTATSTNNYFSTTDFKTFKPLTSLHPETEYNWYTTEQIIFKTTDGRNQKGILYKPENFNPGIKYPVIVNFYEKKSERLNVYIYPDYSDGDINISYFVSRGYLVFTPDIDYKMGETGESALQSIIGGANHLAKLPFVNARKMAICGHSFGGFETLYTITHSNLFAAAFADAGPSNFTAMYGDVLLSDGRSIQQLVEKGQIRMGSSLWHDPKAYINNSAVFAADKATTPVLIVNNKMDAIVHFEQGLQMFLALRRLGKKAWLLQYDDETHSIGQLQNRKDLTIRLTQFFDYYLKDAPCPSWMIKGIPAKLKGIETGYEYDKEREAPGEGLLMPVTPTIE